MKTKINEPTENQNPIIQITNTTNQGIQNSNSQIQNQNNFITRRSQNSIIAEQKEKEKEEFWVPIPYIGNISNKVGGYLRRKLKWKVTFTPGTKITNKLRSLKDKEKKNQSGVYTIPCKTCNDIYIGESMRYEDRKEDHQGNVRRREYNKSAIARHVIRNKQHEINWDRGKIILQEKQFNLRKIKEGLAIQQSSKSLMNTDNGQKLSNAWNPIIPNVYEFIRKKNQNS